MNDKKLYTKDSIESLSPLEFTRLKPGVYAGDTTYSTQLLVEIVSNAVDEFRLGHGNRIDVTISNKDNDTHILVRDYGQGFLINEMRDDGKTVLEAAFSVLNTSGKYREDGTYEGTSLGSFGIGSKITTFLSHDLKVTSFRDNKLEAVWFKEGVFEKRELDATDKPSGTEVLWTPSEQFFTHTMIEENKVKDLFNTITCLCPGLTINLTLNAQHFKYYSENGINDLVDDAVKNTEVGKIALTLVKEINESNILLKFKITDSGTGIPDDIAKKLALELEKTSDNKTVEENENKGVGLKIAKQYIDLMNGKIWFNSDYGAGTTFYVEIPQTIVSMEPMGDISATDNDIEKKELADYSKYKVLIVDDDYQSLQVSSRLLSRYKFNIETSSSRKDCIYRIKKGEEFDIIFVEPLMDNSNDAEILHVIKQLQLLYKKSYVVALTSNNSATARQTYFEEGIDAFILKPINPSELDNVLNKLLSKEESNQNKKADE